MKTYDGWRGSSWVRLAEPIPIQAGEVAVYSRRAKNRSGWHIVASLIAVAGFVMVVGILLGMNA